MSRRPSRTPRRAPAPLISTTLRNRLLLAGALLSVGALALLGPWSDKAPAPSKAPLAANPSSIRRFRLPCGTRENRSSRLVNGPPASRSATTTSMAFSPTLRTPASA